jgi:exopolysaccharide biosynthesis polyprenyl glycosylphosphotransferase
MNKRIKQVILLIGDLTILHLTLWFSLILRFSDTPLGLLWQSNLPYFLPVFAIWIVVLYIGGAYSLNLAYSPGRFRIMTINSISFAALLSIIYFYVNQSEIAPKTILVIFVLVFSFLFMTWRSVFNFFVKSYLPKNNLAFIGWNKAIEGLLEDIKNQPHHGFNTALVFKSADDINNLPAIIKEKNIHTIVLSNELAGDPKLTESLFDCLSLNVVFYSLVDFYENINSKVPIESINQAWFINNLNEGNRHYFNIVKRIIDLTLSFLLLIISLPFWPLIALAIKLESRGPVFFKQKRVGLNEEVFSMLKFRTMRTDGNDGTMTLKNDKRITKLGNFLRKTRLDEIPQIINIIKGEMSFIGPRPEKPEYVEDLAKQIPFYKTRLLIKPGISGWDQISGIYHSPSLEDTMEKLQYDLYYLKHRSIYFDLAIFLKTISTVLSRGGR